MKPPVMIGIGLAVVLLIVGLLSPRVFYSSGRRTAERARLEADLARRELDRVSIVAPRAGALADPAALKEANLEAAVAKASEALAAIGAEAARQARAAEALAQERHVTPPQLTPLSSAVGAIKQAAGEFETSIRENEALLKAALSDASSAAGTDASAAGVSQTVGLVEYVRAFLLLTEAEGLRLQQGNKQAELLALANEWKATRAQADEYAGMEVSGILAGLRTDLGELSALRAEATQQLNELTAQVAQREQEVAAAEAAMKAARRELLELEKKGFAAGDDAAFAQYRARYLELTQSLQQLEGREQSLRYGGRAGAELVGDDLASAKVKGGELVIGLEELQRRLATAQERAKRLNKANVSLEDHIKYVTDTGRAAQEQAQRFQGRLGEFDARQKTLLDELLEVTNQAFAKEDEALQAANAAVRAFGQSQTATQTWLREISERRSRDTSGKNLAVAAVARDTYVPQFGSSAEAAARLLAARIYAMRVECNRKLSDDLQLFAEIKPGATFDVSAAQDRLKTARDEGLQTLDKARAIYEGLSKGQTLSARIALGALAAAQHLTGRMDPGQAATWLAQAGEAIEKAVEKAEQNPYLARYVEFRDHLGGAAKTTKPAEKTEEKGDDFFSTEKP